MDDQKLVLSMCPLPFISKTICQRVANVYIFAKVFVLAFQKDQNRFHRYYESEIKGSKVRNLSRHIYLCLKPSPPTSSGEIVSNLVCRLSFAVNTLSRLYTHAFRLSLAKFSSSKIKKTNGTLNACV